MLTPRQKALLDYLVDVTRDLTIRGAFKRQAGQSFVDILKREPRAVLAEMGQDVVVVLDELRVGLVGGLKVVGMKFAEGLVSQIAEKLAGRERR